VWTVLALRFWQTNPFVLILMVLPTGIMTPEHN
jgi:hypothetical protein